MDDGNSLKLKEIGNRIRAARVEQHMSQDALAFEADLSLSTVSDIELGKSNLRVVTLIKIIEALKVSADTILRPDVPNVNGIYQSEFSELLSDCSPAEMESIIRLVSESCCRISITRQLFLFFFCFYKPTVNDLTGGLFLFTRKDIIIDCGTTSIGRDYGRIKCIR